MVHISIKEILKMSGTIVDRVLHVIQKKGRGTVFSSQDFLPRFKRWEIDYALTYLEKEEKIIRILAGLYAFPKYSELLGQYVMPDITMIARAIARKNSWKIFPEGNVALNYLGLSTQVPTKYVYLSSGRHRKYIIGDSELEFKELNNRTITISDKNTNLVVQAIIAMGKTSANTPAFIEKLSRCFKYVDWVRIEKKAKKVAVWVLEVITKAKDLSNGTNS